MGCWALWTGKGLARGRSQRNGAAEEEVGEPTALASPVAAACLAGTC
jgi:hypothetical protein